MVKKRYEAGNDESMQLFAEIVAAIKDHRRIVAASPQAIDEKSQITLLANDIMHLVAEPLEAPLRRLREAAADVVELDWSDNDTDAVELIATLRTAVNEVQRTRESLKENSNG